MTGPTLRACPYCQQAIEIGSDGRLVRHWLVAWTGRSVRVKRRRCPYRGRGRPYPPGGQR